MRQVVLDTETTGLEASLGHRIIEIGCVELVNRRATGRQFHRYLNPGRDIEQGAHAVHGLTRERLEREPRFGQIAGELIEFIAGAELIIHNAPFDVAFLELELALAGADAAGPSASAGKAPPARIAEICSVLDTLVLARRLHPGQRNSLDALCRRYGVDNSHRDLHGALLDACLLADVYLAMTGGQSALALGGQPAQAITSIAAAALAATESERQPGAAPAGQAQASRPAGALRVVQPSVEELAAHVQLLELLDRSGGGPCLWRRLQAE